MTRTQSKAGTLGSERTNITNLGGKDEALMRDTGDWVDNSVGVTLHLCKILGLAFDIVVRASLKEKLRKYLRRQLKG